MKTTVSAARIAKAAKLIDHVTIPDQNVPGRFQVRSNSGAYYTVMVWPKSWTCSCAWGDQHSFEPNNECSHALAARYYASDNDIDLDPDVDRSLREPTTDPNTDPFAGL